MTDWTPMDRSAFRPDVDAPLPASFAMDDTPLGVEALESADLLVSTITEPESSAPAAPCPSAQGISRWKTAELAAYYAASWPYRWWFRRRAAATGTMPMVVFMYHRIADDRLTPWTTTTETFARQIDWLSRHCEVVSLEEIQRRMLQRDNRAPCAAITFDDGYAENCRAALPLLLSKRLPCTYFVTVRNILTGERFVHDLERGYDFAPNTLEEVLAMARAGVEIGVHGYTHADIAAISDDRLLYRELVVSRRELQRITGQAVRYFAFPYGLYQNMSVRAFRMVQQAGYSGVCSAYGGYNLPGEDPFHLQRFNGDQSMMSFVNRASIDPRKVHVARFEQIAEQAGATDHEPAVPDAAASQAAEQPAAAQFAGAGSTLTDGVLLLLMLTVVQRMVGFVREIFFCRWLDHEHLGQWNVAFAFFMMAAPAAVLALPGAFGRYVEYYRARGQLRTLLRRTGIFCGGLALLAAAGIFLARDWFALQLYESTEQSKVVVFLACCLPGVIGFNYLVELFTGLKDARGIAVQQMVNSVAFAVISLSLLAAGYGTVYDLVLAYGAACLVSIVLGVKRLHRTWGEQSAQPEPVSQAAFWGKLLPFAVSIWVGSLLINAFDFVDRYMMIHYSGLSAEEAVVQLGHYHSARIVPLLLVSVVVMISTLATAHLSHDWEAGRRDQVVARMNLLLKLTGFGLAGTVMMVLYAAPLLFGWAFRNKFGEGLAVLPFVLASASLVGLRVMATNYLWCAERAWLGSLALAGGLAVSVSLNLILLPHLGLLGAVLATLVANAVVLGAVCVFGHRWGLRLDRGVWVVSFLPAMFGLGPNVLALTLGLIALAALRSRWIFSDDEKRTIRAAVQDYRHRGVGAWKKIRATYLAYGTTRP